MSSSKVVMMGTVPRADHDLALARIAELSSRVTQLESTWQEREMEIAKQAEKRVRVRTPGKLQEGRTRRKREI